MTLMDFDEMHAAALEAIHTQIGGTSADDPDLPNLRQRRDTIAAHALGAYRQIGRAHSGGSAQVCAACGNWWPCDPFIDAAKGLGVLDDPKETR